jgi:cellulose biosynthesis protein BcsQ
MLDFAKGVVGICQLKGGVGASTLAASLAGCWARNGLKVTLVDLDDVNPHITEWAKVGPACRNATYEFLRSGEIKTENVEMLLSPVEGFDGKLSVVGQPCAYHESFHFKARVLRGAPTANEFMTSLLPLLAAQSDVVVLDFGRSWGMATFSALPFCQHVVLVTDDDPVSIDRSLDSLQRIKEDSDDPAEFDFSRWSILLNGYTKRLVTAEHVADEVKKTGLVPADAHLFVVPFSLRGRQWGALGRTFYDCAEPKVQQRLSEIASALIRFHTPTELKKQSFFQKCRALVRV